jgi:hypothetical protein
MNAFSFLLPVRIDNEDRYNNLNTSLQFLASNFPGSEILLVEDAPKKKCAHLSNYHSIQYFFRENPGNFSRSENINFGLIKSTRPFFTVWDVDCLIKPEQLHKAYRLLSKQKAHIVLPHNEIFVNIRSDLKKEVSSSGQLNHVPYFKSIPRKNDHPEIDVYPIPSGIVVFNRDTLIRIGGFNKKMISYGWEDIEVLKRAKKLGIYYFNLSGSNIVHLDHQRGTDSKVNEHYERNKAEFHKVLSMNKRTLISYIKEDLWLGTDEKKLDSSFLKRVSTRNLIYFSALRFWTQRIRQELRTNSKLHH